jgi:flavin reductase (DIM6/NTAB) family NADH-FMN oxidoreductase RutF
MSDLTRDVTEAFAQLASGVAIISLYREGAPHGLLVSSLIGLSVTPPRVLFTVRKDASAHAALAVEDRCAAAILAEADRADAALFASSRPAAERFASPAWDLSAADLPRFRGGLARFDLAIEQRIDAGTHTIVIAAVKAISGAAAAPPLVYHGRALTGLAPARVAEHA